MVVACKALLLAMLVRSARSHPEKLTQGYVLSHSDEMWRTFKTDFGRNYTGKEDRHRFETFVDNMRKAAVLQEANPLATFGPNAFSDFTIDEFLPYHNSGSHYQSSTPCPGTSTNCCELADEAYSLKKNAVAPSAVDWREKGTVTSVKDQGRCGSCWAFAATGTVEGQWAAAGHKLTDLSTQEFVSCEVDDLGCSGGRVDTALRWLARERHGNMVTEKTYPYVSASGTAPPCADKACWALVPSVSDDWCTANCKPPAGVPVNCPATLCSCNGTNPHIQIGAKVTSKGCKDVAHNEEQMATWLAQHGPFAAAVAASTWTSYKGGILTSCDGAVDHGVTVVGYGSETINGNETKFWIIKNSWAETWGEKGYIRLAFGSDLCHITFRPVTALVEPVHVALIV